MVGNVTTYKAIATNIEIHNGNSMPYLPILQNQRSAFQIFIL